MSFASLLLLAVGLAADATAVAAARGLAVPAVRVGHALRVALLFGGFQAVMPLFGWLLGARLGPLVAAWDHWIAFGLLSALGAKMLWEARGRADARPEVAAPASAGATDPFAWRTLLGLAVATSIDAFAVGLTLPMLGAPLPLSLATIGVTTALLSAAGLYAGRRLGALVGRRLDALGGAILIALGVKILVEHLWAP